MNPARQIFILLISLITLLLLAFRFDNYHLPAKLIIPVRNNPLPTGYNNLFAGSGTCAVCHNSMTNGQGAPIGIANDWRSTMMGNSAKDPLWQAKVSHEGLVNPSHKEALENVCTTCHAPVGNINAHYAQKDYYTIAEMKNDPLALDGVQCTVCHQITPESSGNFSGTFSIGTNKIIWGPFSNPFINPMLFNTGYTPVHSNHINNSELCASCHTLLTDPVDLNGVATGEKFVEQAIYQEWKNSVFPTENKSCQSCHVPRINDSVKISTVPPWLQPRSPFGMHHFAGANIFMGKIFKENIVQLGITASTSNFDSTISRSSNMLTRQSLSLSVEETGRTNDTLFLNVLLTNKAGHKFPSGFPSRRAFIELIARTNTGDTIFHSGRSDDNHNLIAENTDYEPHFNTINSEDEVQIYEMVMGDVEGNVTTVLERAYQTLKDNRIPPEGFTTTHPSYDTTKIEGFAATDPDFNKQNGIEGCGCDKISYHVPLNNYFEEIEIVVNVFYQTVNDKWLDNMFSYTSDDINRFKNMYENSDRTPVLVQYVNTMINAGFDAVLSEGWNSLSCFILPENAQIDSVLQFIINSMEIMIGDSGTIYPAGSIHTIDFFDPFQGYSIKMTSPAVLSFRGSSLSNRSKTYETGWHLLPVLSSCEMPINSLNQNFIDKINIIVELAGWRVYWPEKQIATLAHLSPGKAYLVNLKDTATIIFSNCY
ncbi:MAG TPA: multiheme c-type cytochrome [Bacteroidales bacterium]|nr:multiheme c-type cytochrome [Bacteroidales bacterium]